MIKLLTSQKLLIFALVNCIATSSNILFASHSSDVPKESTQTIDAWVEKHSTDQIIHDMQSNTEFEKFYAQANFRKKMKRYYFALKIVATIGIALGIYYLEPVFMKQPALIKAPWNGLS